MMNELAEQADTYADSMYFGGKNYVEALGERK